MLSVYQKSFENGADTMSASSSAAFDARKKRIVEQLENNERFREGEIQSIQPIVQGLFIKVSHV